MSQQPPPRDDEVVTAYTAGKSAPPPAYPGQPVNMRADKLKPLPKPKSSGWTLASLACGSIGFIIPVIPSILGIVFGYLGLKKAAPHERSKPVVAMVWSVIGLIICTTLIVPRGLRAYEIANRVECAGRLNHLKQAIFAYAEKHEGQLPDELHTLLQESPALITVDDLACPGEKEKKGSYLYFGKGFSTNIADPKRVLPKMVLASESMANHNEDGANFVMGNGQIVWEGERYSKYLIREAQAGHNPPAEWNGMD